jgi:Domain of unknown function (DUF397)
MAEPAPGAAGAAGWRRSRHSGSTGGHCVEVAPGQDGTIRVRDSKDPAGPVLAFAAGEWAAFVRAVSGGELASG